MSAAPEASVRTPARASPRRREALAGALLLIGLWVGSLLANVAFPEQTQRHCPFGPDVLRPDQTVCELAFGGLWVSLSIGLLAGALATVAGLLIAVFARTAGGGAERWTMRLTDAYFSLPDVLLLMVLQTALQTLGELQPRLAVPAPLSMVISLALVGWAAPARMFRNRLASLEAQEFIAAAKALGGSRLHLFRVHLWPGVRVFAVTVFLTRVPAAILAESTVSFFGIARMEPMSLGRYLGTSYSALLYEGGARIVLPAWALLLLVVLGATLASRGLERSPGRQGPGAAR